jgi:hypothetical protein
MERIVIELPHKDRGEEDNFKVEFVHGKMLLNFLGLLKGGLQ